MRVTVTIGEITTDLELEHFQHVSVAQLAVACGLPPGPLLIDDVEHAGDTAVRDIGLTSGARFEWTGAELKRPTTILGPKPSAILGQVGGWNASGSVPLDAGDYALSGRNEPGLYPAPIEDPDLYVRVTTDGARVKSGDRRYVYADRQAVDDVTNARHRLVVTGGSAFAFAGPSDEPILQGDMLWNRPPRPASPVADVNLILQSRPPAVPGRQALSWAMLLAPIPIGIVMAFLWSPIFALFVLMSPVMMLAQWAEGRRTVRKEERRFGRQFAETLASLREELAAKVEAEQRRLRQVSPDVALLRRWAHQADQQLWARRPEHDDFLKLSAGFADQPIVLTMSGPGSDNFDEAKQLVDQASHGVNLPVEVDLLTDRSVAVVGPRPLALALARSLLLQATTLHGPADVDVMLAADPDRTQDWDFAKWLPHLRSGGADLQVATKIDELDGLLPEPPSDRPAFGSDQLPTGPVMLCVVDSDTMASATASPLRAAMGNPHGSVHAIVVAENRDMVPASCGMVVEIDQTAVTSARRPALGLEIGPIIPAGVGPVDAGAWSRSLTRYHDPEVAGASAGIATALTLTDLIGVPRGDEILGRWKNLPTDPTPRGVVGVTDSGPLTIDLGADGPHGLVAGTTGSGKSELLRTMIASMAWEVDSDHLNFVLIDFKGGGAFDVCADLPHVVSVVTDLDEHLAERALRCLKAELRLREELLRKHSATDLGEYLANPDVEQLPRLVVIVDEFATLAVELPDFLDSLVDIAQRGRSLGVHMILATQRPSGVLDNKVRANTNLRIALRVQDDGDSDDVIGTGQAALLSRRQPGRAFARFGQSEITEFQTALVTGAYVPAEQRNIEARPFELLSTDSGDNNAPNLESVSPATDIELVVSAIRDAFALGGYVQPRIPWPDPLPEEINAVDLLATADNGQPSDFATPIGLMDVPDRQRQEPYLWAPQQGNTIMYGINSGETANTMCSIALGLVSKHSPASVHLYGLQYGANTLSPLADLPHCGDVVDGADLERTLRLIGLLNAEIASRRDRMAAGERRAALTLFFVDNYAGLSEALDEAGEFDAISHAAQIIRDGPAVGVFSILGAQSERGVPLRLANLVEHKLLFRLVDPNSYSAFGLRPRDVPALGPGRFLNPEVGELVQAGFYDGGDASQSVARLLAEKPWPDSTEGLPASVRVLLDHYEQGDLSHSVGNVAVDELSLPIGVDATTLETVCFSLAATEHALVVGGSGSGKSTLLVAVAMTARRLDPALTIVGVAHRRSPLRSCPAISALVGRPTTAAQLQALIEQERVLVLVDDADSIPTDQAAVIQSVANQLIDGRHIIAACRPDYPKDFDSWVGPLRRNQSGATLQPNPNDGDALRTMLPLHRPERFPVGRGFLIANGVPELTHFALPERFDPVVLQEVAGAQAEAPSDEDPQTSRSGSRIDLGLGDFSTEPEEAAKKAAPIDLGLSDYPATLDGQDGNVD